MQTYLGITQRTDNGRFLYGRAKNYRLKPCLMSLVNYTMSIASISPSSGAAPLVTAAVVPLETPDSLTPGIQSNWPSNGGGMSAPNEAGGIIVQDSGYARINDAPAIDVVKTWKWGDGDPDTDVAFNSSTPHTYTAPGTYVPEFVCTDSLARPTTQILQDIVAS